MKYIVQTNHKFLRGYTNDKPSKPIFAERKSLAKRFDSREQIANELKGVVNSPYKSIEVSE